MVWPQGYGCGSGTIKHWIKKNLANDSFSGRRDPLCRYMPDDISHWGEPPRLMTRDYRDLPCGGKGSGTMAGWIRGNLKIESKKCKGKPFPSRWGSPPLKQTKDKAVWPWGYGCGSSTVKQWIMEKMAWDDVRVKCKQRKNFPNKWGQAPVEVE